MDGNTSRKKRPRSGIDSTTNSTPRKTTMARTPASLLGRTRKRSSLVPLAVREAESATGSTSLPLLLSPGEAAKLLGMSPRTLERWRSQGSGPPWLRMGSGQQPVVRYCTVCTMASLAPGSDSCARSPSDFKARQPNGRASALRGREAARLAAGFEEFVGRFEWTHFVGLSCSRRTASEAWVTKAARAFATKVADTIGDHVRISWVVELQRRGTPHVHMLLCVPPASDIRSAKIGRLWTHGIADVRAYEPEGGGASYMAKELGGSHWEPPIVVCPTACPYAGECGADLSTPWA